MRKILACMLFLTLIGCAHIQVEADLKGGKHVDWYPTRSDSEIRELKLMVVYNDNENLNKRLKQIEKASYYAERDAGIRFKVVKVIKIGEGTMYGRFSSDPDWALGALMEVTQPYKKEFDIALGFATDDHLTRWLGWALNKPFGVIEDGWRRYIIFQDCLSYKIILHEIYHAFVLCEGHTSKVLNSPWPTSPWLNSEDRKTVIRNKWRNFQDPHRPYISPEYVHDGVIKW